MVETEAYDCKSQYLFKPDSEHELNREAQGLTLQLSHTITGKSQGLSVKDRESLPRCGENPQNCSNWANATITEKRPQMSNKVLQVGGKKGGGTCWYKSQHVFL